MFKVALSKNVKKIKIYNKYFYCFLRLLILKSFKTKIMIMTSQIIKLFTIATMTSLAVCTHNFRGCDPENPIACGFGAKCDKVSKMGKSLNWFLI